ncbi:hypothetical protein [Agrobacterium tumefaciens]|uniref:hypothetical protein n=1 Tax=Agrobacterium tumefaciens TaxID=358 RepID=UPI001571C552|nr:hypothetical protein [Agrobacterium tumefaciens]
MKPPVIGDIPFGGNGVGENQDNRIQREIAARIEAQNAARGTFDYIPDAGKAVKASSQDNAQGQGQPDHVQARASRGVEDGTQRVINEGRAAAPQAPERAAVEYDENGKKRTHFDTAAERNRIHDVASAIRGRMDAAQAAGKAEFGEGINIPTERGNAIADRAFMKAQDQFSKPEPDFSAMADRARSAGQGGKDEGKGAFRVVGNSLNREAKSEGQGDQFSAMADRARSAAQSTASDGNSKSKGMEQ